LETKTLKVEDLDEADLYTLEEAAEYLDYHPEHVRRLARGGEVRGFKWGRRGEWRFRKEDLDAIRVRLWDPREVNA